MSILKELFMLVDRSGKRFNYNLMLQNRSWVVIGGPNQIDKLIFRENNELIISQHNVVKKGSWQYLSQDHSLLVEYDSVIQLFSTFFLEEDVVCLVDQSAESIFFMMGNNHIIKTDINAWLKEILYKKLNIRTAMLDSGENLEVFDVSNSKNDSIIGKTVAIDLKKVENGIYYRNNGLIEFHVQVAK